MRGGDRTRTGAKIVVSVANQSIASLVDSIKHSVAQRSKISVGIRLWPERLSIGGTNLSD